MALTDPQSVTINAVANSLPRVTTGVNTSTYSSSDGNVKMVISHAYGKRNRRTVRLEYSKVAPDPFVADRNVRYSMSTYIVIDVPNDGFTVTEAKQIVDGLTAYLTASSGANVTKVLGGEN